ncbi:hypothetical protein ACTXKZ_06535 [Brachybacterium alimentarium]|uniref:hypothetical protein n=1 Tax=Brachybacterium alimentarium TaxID=47845 RepID=UPI003FD35FE7
MDDQSARTGQVDRVETAVIPALRTVATYQDAEQLLRAAGWTDCGAGDWAFALAAPGADVVARISPFDPVGPYTARLYREAATTGLVPRLLLHRRLDGGGDLQVMQRLEDVPVPEAEAFLARFALPAPELADLAQIVGSLHADAQRELAWCGPLDGNPSNVMRTRSGRLLLTDPYYADGPTLYAAAEQDPDRFVTTIPADQRRGVTQIPLACSGPWAAEDREALRLRIQRADERAATTGLTLS